MRALATVIIVDPMLLRLFQDQVRLHCVGILAAAERVDAELAALTRTASDASYRSQDAFWLAIGDLLNASANVTKALWGKHGTPLEKRQLLRQTLDVSDESPLCTTSMRNSFEHFDERLDKWWMRSPDHIIVDHVIGQHLVSGVAEEDKFRQYNPTTGDLVFWGERFNLLALVGEARRILPVAAREAAKPWW